jgi:hypothetical protein
MIATVPWIACVQSVDGSKGRHGLSRTETREFDQHDEALLMYSLGYYCVEADDED